MDDNWSYYIVREDALPSGLKAVSHAQGLLRRGKAKTIDQAVKMAGVSRSTYYAYRDCIQPYHRADQGGIITLQAVLVDRAGVLSTFLNVLAKAGFNVLTVNQSIPISGQAGITLSLRTEQRKMTLEALIKKLLAMDGVVSAEVMLGK